MLDFIYNLNIATPLAFAMTYLLHCTVWILSIAILVKVPFFQSAIIRNYFWKAALIGGLVTSCLVCYLGNNSFVIEVPNQSTENRVAESNINTEGLFDQNIPVQKSSELDGLPAKNDGQSLNNEEVTLNNGEINEAEKEIVEPALDSKGSGNMFYSNYVFPIIFNLFILLWISISLFLFLKLIIQHVFFFKKINNRKSINHPTILNNLKALQQKANLSKKIKLSKTTELDSPILIRNSEICLPENALINLDDNQLKGMLAHELAHIARKDYFWNCFIALMDVLFFFQPLHRLVKKEINTTNELLCDEWAAKITGDHLALAKCLVTVAGWIKERPKNYAFVAGMSLKKSELSNRIQSLINLPDMKRQRFNRLKAALLFCLFLAVAGLVLPGFTFSKLINLDGDHPIFLFQDNGFQMDIELPDINLDLNIGDDDGSESGQESVIIIDGLNEHDENDDLSDFDAIQPLNNSPIVIQPDFENPLNDKLINLESGSINNQPLILLEDIFPSNRKHKYFKKFNSAAEHSDRYIAAIYKSSVKCSNSEDYNSRGKIITNKGFENSLIFTLNYGSHVIYDTLQNCVHPAGKGPLALFGKSALRDLKKNIPFSGSYSPVKGRSPKVVKSTWVQQTDSQKATPMGLELLEEAEVKIEVKTMEGEHIATIVNKTLSAGIHEFTWPHVGVKRGYHQLDMTVNGETISMRINVKNVKRLNKNKVTECAPLLRAVKKNEVAKVRQLATKSNVNCVYREDGEPRTPLNAAARNGNVEIGKILLQNGADVEHRAKGDEGALMGAARNGHFDFVKLMVENGAKVNRQINGDGTALINAVRGGHYEVAEYLLENGADPMQSSPGDENPIYHASEHGDKMLDLILRYRKK